MDKRALRYAWFMWSLGAFFYFYQFILRVSPSVMTDALMRDFSVEACTLGVLAAFYYNTYSILQIPVGIMIDRYGPKLLLRWAILICVGGTFIFLSAEDVYMAGIGRMLIGAGGACAFIGTLKLSMLWFPPEKMAMAVGFTIVLGKLGGGGVAGAPLAAMVDGLGWRESMMILTLIGLVLSFAVWYFLKDGPNDNPHILQPKGVPPQNLMKEVSDNLKQIFTNRPVWMISIYGCLMYVPMSAFADVWGVPFLQAVYDVDRAKAAWAVTWLFVGSGVGAPIMAYISNRMEQRRLPMALSVLASIVSNCVLIFVPGIPFFWMYILLFIVGISFTGQTLIFTAVSEIMPKSMGGTVTGFTNMVVMLSGVVLQPLIGWLLDWVWDGVMGNGIPLYTPGDYRIALSSIPLAMILAGLLIPFMPETYPKRIQESASN